MQTRLISQVEHITRHRPTEHGEISIQIEISDIKTLAEPMLEKVFYSLVDNSVRHGGHVKNMKMSSEDRSDGLRVMSQNDGKGIEGEDKERIFDVGFGEDSELGLYLCREILALAGASMVENGKPEGGARFEVVVPSINWALA